MRFTTYGTLKVRLLRARPPPLRPSLTDIHLPRTQSFVQGSRPGEALPAGITFAIGAVAGVVTVYATMPLEYVPSFHCLAPFAFPARR